MLKEDLSKKNVKFEYINILESMRTLKDFLYFRDNHEEIFREHKENDKLGIPLVVIESENGIELLTDRYKADFINTP